ncbi:LADA_0A03840g1_1 [Lachancea dasiensis]|uniref:LADA_0A03840g1_1 n=1 Tax=Lachancea dasiensis TaxID=1072105 RepID=A0A1G4IN97_9SACH|nr:LADA_0A03840g1_1 [Lachancea dasiensis]
MVDPDHSLSKKLEQAFIDYEDDKDALSLVTVIDLYGSEINKEGTIKEKARFLETILTNLKSSSSVIESIGWDLPKMLINFLVMKNVDLDQPLSHNVLVSTTLKCFNEIALRGNAKECFLTGCELLGGLQLETFEKGHSGSSDDETEEEEAAESETDGTVSSETFQEHVSVEEKPSTEESQLPNLLREPEEFALELQLHALMELVNTTLKRIHTCYPSRFLATAVGAILSFVKFNGPKIDDVPFILRRVYNFCRTYIPPQSQEEVTEKLSSEEHLKLMEDEEALERRLLQCLLTHALGQAVRERTIMSSPQYFFDLKKADSSRLDYDQRRDLREAVSRFHQLAYSFDIDVEKEFRALCIEESKSIYNSLPNDSEFVNEAAKNGITQLIYQLSYTYGVQKRLNEKNLALDPHGILAIATFHYEETGQVLCTDVRVDEAIYMYLRFFTPEVMSQTERHRYAVDCCQFWLWRAVTSASCQKNQEILRLMPGYLLSTFLQILLLKAFHETLDVVRMVAFTFITRMMCLIPEGVSFEFVKDTLLNCPFSDLKCCVLGILKDLMLNTRYSVTDVTEKLSTFKVSSDTQEEPAQGKPALPPRSYIIISEDRMASVHSLAMMSFEETITSPVKANLRLTLRYLNFFISLRLKWDYVLLCEIEKKVSEVVEKLGDDSQPELGFIEIANNSLLSYLREKKAG